MFACRPDPVAPTEPTAAAEDPVDLLAQRLAGRFDSVDQAAADPDNYRAVQLHACVVEAPELGRRVLYIEQALVERVSAPYRQRLYVLAARAQDGASSRVFELKDPGPRVGLCDAPAHARRFGAAEVVEREGCRVELVRDGEAYRGGTVGKGCTSGLAGASYATSEVTITAQQIESWDRGFAADGSQVWGAELGPYRFARRSH